MNATDTALADDISQRDDFSPEDRPETREEPMKFDSEGERREPVTAEETPTVIPPESVRAEVPPSSDGDSAVDSSMIEEGASPGAEDAAQSLLPARLERQEVQVWQPPSPHAWRRSALTHMAAVAVGAAVTIGGIAATIGLKPRQVVLHDAPVLNLNPPLNSNSMAQGQSGMPGAPNGLTPGAPNGLTPGVNGAAPGAMVGPNGQPVPGAMVGPNGQPVPGAPVVGPNGQPVPGAVVGPNGAPMASGPPMPTAPGVAPPAGRSAVVVQPGAPLPSGGRAMALSPQLRGMTLPPPKGIVLPPLTPLSGRAPNLPFQPLPPGSAGQLTGRAGAPLSPMPTAPKPVPVAPPKAKGFTAPAVRLDPRTNRVLPATPPPRPVAPSRVDPDTALADARRNADANPRDPVAQLQLEKLARKKLTTVENVAEMERYRNLADNAKQRAKDLLNDPKPNTPASSGDTKVTPKSPAESPAAPTPPAAPDTKAPGG